ncbi:alpha/beta hydrolase fold domain-containing protein [Pseudonocardia pini]|uniref:alpha/beta hydrolase fold domain-containing protein n=1 Tax=Pseudonocardia pini TaxID=2758030 RepID=UPI0015F0F328|nr:alpha/beta hydrolase fold domain-containing protein [Pseudonocardia pini]
MRLTLPCAAVRTATRLLVAPSLSPRLPLPLARRLVDLQGMLLPVPRGTRTERTALGLRVGTPGTDATSETGSARRVLFLHGGGYLVGSPRSHRSVAAWLAEAAGAPVELLDYRLAPEHPYPAALDDAEHAYRDLLAGGQSPQRLAVAWCLGGALRRHGPATPGCCPDSTTGSSSDG